MNTFNPKFGSIPFLKMYILENLENDLQYILNHLCCCIPSIELLTLYILIWWKENSVGDKIDEDDDDHICI